MTSPISAYVTCTGHLPNMACGSQALTQEQYLVQLDRPNRPWLCPRCGAEAEYDDALSEPLQIAS